MIFTATGPSPLLARIAGGDAGSLLAGCRSLDIRLWVEDGRLRFDAPRGGLDPVIRVALVANKVELIALLTRPVMATSAGPDLCSRWGPSLDHAEPSIDVPADHWRWRVACLPHDEWIRWRSRSAEIQAAFASAMGLPLDADAIIEADRTAAAEMGIPGAYGRPEA